MVHGRPHGKRQEAQKPGCGPGTRSSSQTRRERTRAEAKQGQCRRRLAAHPSALLPRCSLRPLRFPAPLSWSRHLHVLPWLFPGSPFPLFSPFFLGFLLSLPLYLHLDLFPPPSCPPPTSHLRLLLLSFPSHHHHAAPHTHPLLPFPTLLPPFSLSPTYPGLPHPPAIPPSWSLCRPRQQHPSAVCQRGQLCNPSPAGAGGRAPMQRTAHKHTCSELLSCLPRAVSPQDGRETADGSACRTPHTFPMHTPGGKQGPQEGMRITPGQVLLRPKLSASAEK